MKKRKIETSKKILVFVDILLIVVIITTIVTTFLGLDPGALPQLIDGCFALAGVAHGFYFWKAKAENLHKYGLDEKIDNNEIM